jgi:hypothetical protein
MLNFDWLEAVPISVAKAIFLFLFIAIGILVQLIPARQIFEGVDERHWWLNLKLWAWAVLGVIFFTYLIF